MRRLAQPARAPESGHRARASCVYSKVCVRARLGRGRAAVRRSLGGPARGLVRDAQGERGKQGKQGKQGSALHGQARARGGRWQRRGRDASENEGGRGRGAKRGGGKASNRTKETHNEEMHGTWARYTGNKETHGRIDTTKTAVAVAKGEPPRLLYLQPPASRALHPPDFRQLTLEYGHCRIACRSHQRQQMASRRSRAEEVFLKIGVFASLLCTCSSAWASTRATSTST